MTVRASPIQTLTVGTGIPPVQPVAVPCREAGPGSWVADYDRRFGLTPTPEHVICVLLFCHNRTGRFPIPAAGLSETATLSRMRMCGMQLNGSRPP
jgi:hypothetical protein